MMKDTGERVIPELMKPMNKLLLEHIARYQFALHYVKGRVLDLSCGSGYGTHMIAKEKKNQIDEVIGVDIDSEIITYAKGTYYHPQSSFLVLDAIDLSVPGLLGQSDSIVSFETIEHIEQETNLLDNYFHLLKPGGILMVSTPFGEGRGITCGSPFHVHQLPPLEFKSLFGNYSKTEYFYQKGVLIEPEGRNVHYPLGIAICTK
ncbi:class I SAM-dependent methyltransferase [Aquibacillus rhizosphaerae]|uniref:Methyltransferase domain-containing protein n=1 Tax=Aquibacillus rhizosphaerae TaxID=3051431 RepID=A0ABT7L2P8_9BACI|nr:methyltransferase domain-containing protein [Aquibacillus sp. LR5S19]MDL4840138.1 methyltransferase domain-containing protein [Aquibacillus sp. LR5S19]